MIKQEYIDIQQYNICSLRQFLSVEENEWVDRDVCKARGHKNLFEVEV